MKFDFVLYFGRYSEEKGIGVFCSVCKELRDIPFICVGKGPLKGVIDSIPNMIDVGFQPQESIKRLIREAKFVVVPSVVYESFGLSAIESISCGTPVIASDIGGLQEILTESKAGIMFKAGDKTELKNTVRKLWNYRSVEENLKVCCRVYKPMTTETYYEVLVKQIYTNEGQTVKKNLFLIDCDTEEIIPFYNEISRVTRRKFELRIDEECIALNKSRNGLGGELKRYFRYFATAFQLFRDREQYDLIVCWQQFYALIFCLYCSFFCVSKCNLVVACNYTYKEKKKFGRLYYKFMKYCMDEKYLDFIHIPSVEYAKTISDRFNFDEKKIIVAPFGIPDIYEKYRNVDAPEDFHKNEYYFSVGRSNRDFDFLIRAWSGVGRRLVIASDTYEGDANNENVKIRRDISADEQYVWIANCKALIIPIDEPGIASGDTTLLTGMSFEKIVIVTKPSTLAEMYIKNEVDGIAVDKDVEEFQAIIEKLERGEFNYIRHKAREKYLKEYSREILARNIATRINEKL